MITKKQLRHTIEMRTIKYAILRRCIHMGKYNIKGLKQIALELESKTLEELIVIHRNYVGYSYIKETA